MLACVRVRDFVFDPHLLLLPSFFSLLLVCFPRRVPVTRVSALCACPSSNSLDVRHDLALSFTIARLIGVGFEDPSCNDANARLPPYHRSSTLSEYSMLLLGASSRLTHTVECVRFLC